MATYAFIRVSTLEQDTEKNKIDILQQFANRLKLGNVEFTEEQCSGKINYKERKLGALIESMQAGDVLIVPELSRIARSITQILEVIKVTKDKGITLFIHLRKTSVTMKTPYQQRLQVPYSLLLLRLKEN